MRTWSRQMPTVQALIPVPVLLPTILPTEETRSRSYPSGSTAAARTSNKLTTLLLLLLSFLTLNTRAITADFPDAQCTDSTDSTDSTDCTDCTDSADCTVCRLQSEIQREKERKNSQSRYHNEQCDLFLAQSTIPGAGLGIFVGSEKQPGDTIGYGDLAIPLIDLEWHIGGDLQDYFSIFEDYQWAGHVMGMSQESHNDDVEAFCPGLDSAINCHLALINVKTSYPQFNASNLERHSSPGAGAITPYIMQPTHANAHIPPGGELFKFYGNSWFQSRPQQFGLIPLRHHHHIAHKITKNWKALPLPTYIQHHLWNIVTNMPWESRALNALPNTPQLAQQAALNGITSLYQPNATRSIHELRHTGVCLDNIRHDISTLPNAGRGAFATRFLPTQTIITASPILHIPILQQFTHMYHPMLINGRSIPNKNNRAPDQIITNYCFGHRHSSLLLCPYGSGVNFINHNAEKPNVKIRWAQHGSLSHNNSWFFLTPDQLFDHRINLAFEFVATADIQQGDELFLDYGPHWQAAWDAHVRNWIPSDQSGKYKPSAYWNRFLKDTPLRTTQEQTYEPYPDHVLIKCHHKLAQKNWMSILETTGHQLWKVSEQGYHCDIIDRYLDEQSKAFVYNINMDVEDDNGDFVKTIFREGVPRIGISFVDFPSSSDLHLQNAFRHAIHMPDSMVPDAWLNRKLDTPSSETAAPDSDKHSSKELISE